MKKGNQNNQIKWMKSAMEIGTYVMSLMFACILFSLFYFSILNSASDRLTHQTVSTIELKVQPYSVPEENNNASDNIVGTQVQPSSAVGENNQVSETTSETASAVDENNQVSETIGETTSEYGENNQVSETTGETTSAHGENNQVSERTDEATSALGENNQVSETTAEEIKRVKTQITRPSCTSNYITTVCEIQGDQVLIHGNSKSVYFRTNSKKNKTWTNRPYPRKYDTAIMNKIPKVKITRLYDPHETSKCNISHNITAVIFAIGGYNGNFYHDFTDVLVPLFVTARQFEGEVQFFIANMQIWWVYKYSRILNKLSNYEIIDFEKENNMRCYPRVIVGLYSHKDMTMDPSQTPNNYSMVDFAKLMRNVYSLERDFAISLRENTKRKPRILIIPRKNSRSLTNMDEIVPMVEELGFEVFSNESDFHTNVGDFARYVNTFDVLMGVHGAGLTNLVFLPTNAILIQIIPVGNLDRICDYVFGEPARDMKLLYLHYSISEKESTLREKYASDDPVFRDPDSLHKKGWMEMAKVYLGEQNVKLNVTRFKPILEKARELLN